MARSYEELKQAQIELQKEIDEAKKIEAETMLIKVKSIIKEFGFTAKDLEIATKKKSVHHKVQFKNGDDEYTGYGKPPAWIVDMLKKYGNDKKNPDFKAELETYRITKAAAE